MFVSCSLLVERLSSWKSIKTIPRSTCPFFSAGVLFIIVPIKELRVDFAWADCFVVDFFCETREEKLGRTTRLRNKIELELSTDWFDEMIELTISHFVPTVERDEMIELLIVVLQRERKGLWNNDLNERTMSTLLSRELDRGESNWSVYIYLLFDTIFRWCSTWSSFSCRARSSDRVNCRQIPWFEDRSTTC